MSTEISGNFDRGRFRQCQDTAFCRRFRSFQEISRSPTLVGPRESEISSSGTFNFPMRRAAETDWSLRLEISVFQGGVARLLIRDLHAAKERYRVGSEVLENQEISDSAEFSTQAVSGQGVSVITDAVSGLRMEIAHENFQVRVFQGDLLVQTVNARNFFNFERQRGKFGDRCASLVPEKFSDFSVDAACADPREAWEERWDGWVDRKSLGPMAVGVDFRFHGGLFAYGLPEHAAAMVLEPNRDIRMFNLDVAYYPLDESEISLYGSVPLLNVVHEGGRVWSGVFAPNPSEAFWRVTSDADTEISGTSKAEREIREHGNGERARKWLDAEAVFETGNLELYVWTGTSGSEMLRKYFQVTGKPQTPGLWSLGFHQCRWNYRTSGEVEEVSRKFLEHGIPLETIWLDIEYADEKRYFQWDKGNFPEPGKMIGNLEKDGRRLVTIVDPHVKKDAGFFVWKEISEARQPSWVRTTDGSVFQGQCWPGESNYPDFFQAEMRTMWGDFWKKFPGISDRTMIWNDMNEPSVFSGPELTMPKNAMHLVIGNSTEHRELHNQYGQMYVRGSHEGLLRRSPQIPFILTRSFFAGTHKLRGVATWTGDNEASWRHLEISFEMLLNSAVGGGFDFVGADVGGFFGHPEKELFFRWHQVGAMSYPFYRSHAHIDSPRREPWVYDAETLEIVKNAISERYRLLLFWYASFKKHAEFGEPVIKPLFFEDGNFRPKQRELIVGDTLLVKMVAQKNVNKISIDLPNTAAWVDYWTGRPVQPETAEVEVVRERIPVFVKRGRAIIYREVARKSSVFMRTDPVTLRFYADERMQAEGFGYFDDEETRDSTSSFVKFVLTAGKVTVEAIGNVNFPGPLIDRVEIFTVPKDSAVVNARVQREDAVIPVDVFFQDEKWIFKKPNVLTTDTTWTLLFDLVEIRSLVVDTQIA